MKQALPIFFLMFVLGTMACGSTALPATLEPAPVLGESPVPDPNLPLPESTAPALGRETQLVVPTRPGLRVVYLREGNLWSWTEAGGSVQLTGTSDMSTVSLSNDGRLLAFMRRREVWTVSMNGTDARLLTTQNVDGGALWFAPNGSLLAVSTADHIDVIDLNTSNLGTVITYPTIPGGYYPEVIWSPDASGFKTVIPPQTASGQAELLFVFTGGTVASLAKFMILPLTESLPYISPDGGYIIYAAKLGDGKESLYLMDSSGAARPYGDSAANVRAFGWLPDAKRFAYVLEDAPRAFLGDVTASPVEINLSGYRVVNWVDGEYYLALQDGSLYLGDTRGGELLIDEQVSDFDFWQ